MFLYSTGFILYRRLSRELYSLSELECMQKWFDPNKSGMDSVTYRLGCSSKWRARPPAVLRDERAAEQSRAQRKADLESATLDSGGLVEVQGAANGAGVP